MRRLGIGVGVLAALLVSLSPLAARAGSLSGLAGHLAFGYGQLFIEDSPSGSLSVAGGVDVPLSDPIRIGLDLGFHLLGSRTVERGSLLASLDYSAFEAALLVHWVPATGFGPLERVSLGPALVAARAELSTAGAGVGFSDLAVEQTAPGFAAAVSLGSRRDTPVRLGVELAVRTGFVEDGDAWTIGTVRGVVRY